MSRLKETRYKGEQMGTERWLKGKGRINYCKRKGGEAKSIAPPMLLGLTESHIAVSPAIDLNRIARIYIFLAECTPFPLFPLTHEHRENKEESVLPRVRTKQRNSTPGGKHRRNKLILIWLISAHTHTGKIKGLVDLVGGKKNVIKTIYQLGKENKRMCTLA